jgi:hypothetical protein
MKNRFQSLLIALVEAGAEFVVAGGVACVLQGVERVTLDLDLSLNFSPNSVKAFLAVMKDFGLTPRAPVPPDLLADPDARCRMVEQKHAIVFTFQDVNDPFWHVDVFLRDDLAYATLVDSSDTVDLEGHTVHVLSRSQLLRLKQSITPLRPKDQLDIAELARLIEKPDE